MSTLDEICGMFTLTHWEGKAAPTPASLTISRSGDVVTVNAAVGNYMSGCVRYEPNYLVGNLQSADNQLADENQAAIEDALMRGFEDGFRAVVETDRLLLKNQTTSFVFERSVKLDDLFGEHAIIAVNGQPPQQEMTMRFDPDGNGGSFLVANVANSLRGQCQIEAGALRGEVASTLIEADETLTAVETEIRDGLRVGFNIFKTESGILLQSPSGSLQLCQIVSQIDLAGDYVLKTFNGQAVPTTNQPTISFAPKDANEVEISIVVANRIRGAAVLDQNVLTAEEPLMSTRMQGTEEESALESAFNVGFQYGLEAIARGSEVTLKNQDYEFVLTRCASPETSQGGSTNRGTRAVSAPKGMQDSATYKGTQCTKCFKTEANGLLFRIVNQNENKWAFYNDTTDYRMFVEASFGSRSSIEPLNNATMHMDADGRYVVQVAVEPKATEMFIHGDVNGFKVAYSAQPV